MDATSALEGPVDRSATYLATTPLRFALAEIQRLDLSDPVTLDAVGLAVVDGVRDIVSVITERRREVASR